MNDSVVAGTQAAASPTSAPVILGLTQGRLAIAVPGGASAQCFPLELQVSDGGTMIFDSIPGVSQLESRGVALNVLFNSAMNGETLPWRLVEGTEGGKLGVNFSEQWSLKNGRTGYLAQRPGDANSEYVAEYVDPVSGPIFRVAPGARYVLSGYFGVHRCSARMTLEFFDSAGKFVDRIEAPVAGDKFGGQALADYFHAQRILLVPAGATQARLTLVKLPARLASDSSMVLFSDIRLTLSPHGAVPLDSSEMSAQVLNALREAGAGIVQVAYLPLPELGPAQGGPGAERSIAVSYGASRSPAINSPLAMAPMPTLCGRIHGVAGVVIEGQVSSEISAATDPRLWLYVDEMLHQALTPTDSAGQGMLWFRFPLPARLFDGRVHVFTVLAADGQVVAESAELLPHHLVPWGSIDKYASRPLPSALAPPATYRYKALEQALVLHRQALDAAVTAGDASEIARIAGILCNLPVMHRVLVEGYSAPDKGIRFEFPVVKNPDVTIIIPMHNKWSVTRHCLAALLLAPNKATFEVILVDDGSLDETTEIPQRVAGVQYLRNDAAQGFILACNRGASIARGRYVVFLNNDTEPTAGWLDELIYVFDHFAGVGLAGSKLLYPDGQLQEAGGIVWGSGDPWNYGRKANAHDPRYNYLRQADYVSGAAMMLPTSLWKQIGGFSEELIPAYFEDTDLAFKVRAAGRKVVYVPQSVVYHYEGMSAGTSTASGMKRFQEVNRPKFKRKWSAAFAGNGEVGVEVDKAKDRGIRRRALVVDISPPKPDSDAGSYAAIQEIRLLQSLGFKVTFVPENMAYLPRESDRLMRMGVETIYAPFYRTVAEFIEQRGKEFDVVYCTRYYAAQGILGPVRAHAPQAKILFCNADLHFLRQMRDAMMDRDAKTREAAERTRDEELTICRAVDVVLSYSYVEHAVLESCGIERERIALCPWVVDVVGEAPDFHSRADIAYLGGFGHGPNKAAVLSFVETVMPLLRRRLPGVRLRVFGSGSAESLKAMDATDVVIEGYVEDVAPAYDDCRVFVAPLLTGAGIKGKVMTALAHGTPSVISPIAAEGTHIRDGVEAFVVSDPSAWVERIARLYEDEATWLSMSAAAKRLAQERYSFAVGQQHMAKALEQAGIFAEPDPAFLHHLNTDPR